MELDFSNDVIERLLMKKALVDKKWLNIMSKVFDIRWFKVQNIGILLKLVIKYYDKYNSIPNNQVISALTKKYIEKYSGQGLDEASLAQTLSEVTNLDMKLSDEVLNGNLKEFIRRNAFKSSLDENLDMLTTNPNAFEDVVDKCLANFDKVQKITFNDTDLGLNYFDEESMKSHWDFLRNPDAKVSTGWEAVDHYTNGGFLKSGRMLGLFMAQAGLGKSVFLSNLAVNCLKQNLGVVVISLEMSQDVYAQRFDAHISRKNINHLRENETTAISRIREFYQQHPDCNLIVKEFPPRSVTTKDIQAYLENVKAAGNKIDVVIVDYLNLVLPNRRTDSMFKDGMAVSEELRGLSYLLEAPVISAVQANSEGMNTDEIDMQHVSESRGIVHTADFLAALYQTPENRENGIIGFKIIKNRLGGMVGKHAVFKLDPETLSLADITFNNDDICESDDNSELAKIVKSLPNLSADITAL